MEALWDALDKEALDEWDETAWRDALRPFDLIEIDLSVQLMLLHPETEITDKIRALVRIDPEGAARRAQGHPQYDHDRPFAAHLGGEHERTPDGGGDQPQPHPEQFELAAPAALADCE